MQPRTLAVGTGGRATLERASVVCSLGRGTTTQPPRPGPSQALNTRNWGRGAGLLFGHTQSKRNQSEQLIHVPGRGKDCAAGPRAGPGAAARGEPRTPAPRAPGGHGRLALGEKGSCVSQTGIPSVGPSLLDSSRKRRGPQTSTPRNVSGRSCGFSSRQQEEEVALLRRSEIRPRVIRGALCHAPSQRPLKP